MMQSESTQVKAPVDLPWAGSLLRADSSPIMSCCTSGWHVLDVF